jgi:hypothetical protein
VFRAEIVRLGTKPYVYERNPPKKNRSRASDARLALCPGRSGDEFCRLARVLARRFALLPLWLTITG